ncbi:MAG: hypothetical protein IPL26_20630 [Leptospiraceae bacterium]|nr:hypothetical protein [Leptospiraceae bacterium]
MNKIFSVFFLFTLSLFPQDVFEESYLFENLRVIKKPISVPRGPIPSDFISQKSNLVQYVSLGHSSEILPEAALFLESPETVDELIKFYELALQTRDWRILQKDNKGNKQVILGESPSKKVMTILIRDEKDYRVVKIFYRRPGF